MPQTAPRPAATQAAGASRGIVSAGLALAALTLAVGWLTYSPPADRVLTTAEQLARTQAYIQATPVILTPVAAHERLAALQTMQLPPTQQQLLEQALDGQRAELVWLTLWDDRDQDGDTVDVESDGFRQRLRLANAPIRIALPKPRNGIVSIYGVYDGGGGITIAVRTGNAGVIAMPAMQEGQVIGVPVR